MVPSLLAQDYVMMTCDVIQNAVFTRKYGLNKVIETRKAVQCKIIFENFRTETGHLAD